MSPVSLVTNLQLKIRPEVMASVIHAGKVDEHLEIRKCTLLRPPLNVLTFKSCNLYKSSARFRPSHNSNKFDQPKSSNIVNLFAQTGCSRAYCKFNVRIGFSAIHALVDTGAAVSVINTYKALQVDKLYPVDKSDLLGVRVVNGNFIRVLDKVTMPVE
ncbi:unnamed protein product [Mytilus coruscus]|uniref:Peptidase A2 domain-containing protein n=1 Tax=Mytilus coruscus TaxID=42192 RepID=A0A6J8EF87_MYTCO|nr:unnamed protein product [Mytilus coruscus]